MGQLILKTKPIRVAFNMLCCATLFCWAGVLPRETISGLFGRKVWLASSRFWFVGAKMIDKMHRLEPKHCGETFAAEAAMRRALYNL